MAAVVNTGKVNTRRVNTRRVNTRKKKQVVDLTWGFGIEHEMLYSTTLDPKQRRRHVIDSRRIVEAANLEKVRHAFDSIDAALSIALPRVYERLAGPLTCVSLADDLVIDPYFGVCRGEEEDHIIQKLENVPIDDVIIATNMIAPYIGQGSLDGMFYALVDVTSDDEVYTVIQKEFLRLAPRDVIKVFNTFYIDPDEAAQRSLLAKVLSGSSDMFQYIEHVFATLERLLSPDLVADARPGALVYGSMRMHQPRITITYVSHAAGKNFDLKNKEKEKKNKKSLKRHTMPMFVVTGGKKRKRLVVASVVRLYQLQVDLELQPWTDIDGPFVEVKTLNHERATVTKLINELFVNEGRTREYVEKIANAPCRLLEHSCYSDLLFFDPYHAIDGKYPDVSRMPTTEKYYGGSFHYWFTLPHDRKSLMTDDFAGDHLRFAHILQWMEPLLLSLCGGDPSGIGRGASFAPRAAFRSLMNRVGGIGTTNTCALWSAITHILPREYPLVYFDNDASFLSTFSQEVRAEPELSVLDSQERIPLYVDLEDGTTIPLRGCEEVDREPRQGRLVGHSVDQPLPPTVRSHITVPTASRTPHNQLLRIAYSALYSVRDGSNVRVLPSWCDALKLNLRPFWQAYPVKVGEIMKLRFFNSTTGKISMTAPLKEKELTTVTNLTGFEFRLMDNMTLTNVEPLMNLFVLVAAASKESKVSVKTCENVQLNSPWSRTVTDILVKGRFATPLARYTVKLYSLLGIAPNTHSLDCYLSLVDVCDKLHEKYSGHPWVRLMAPKLARSKKGFQPRLVDSNFDAFVEGFELMLAERPDLRVIIDKLVTKSQGSTIQESDIVMALGKDYMYDAPYISEWLKSKALV